jgi:hypothetical protein
MEETMRELIGALCLIIACSPSVAADAKKESSQAQKAHEQRVKDCNAKAAGKKWDERKGFVAACLAAAPKAPTQQERMAKCEKDAAAKALKGGERKSFMSACLKG